MLFGMYEGNEMKNLGTVWVVQIVKMFRMNKTKNAFYFIHFYSSIFIYLFLNHFIHFHSISYI